MARTFALVGLLVAGCGGPAAQTRGSSSDVMGPTDGDAERRTPLSTASAFTVGLRVALGATDADHVRLEAVVIDLDGHEFVTDLGEYVGRPEEQAPEEGELGHLRLTLRDEVHHLVLVRTDDPAKLELRLDGERVRTLDLPGAETVDPEAPFLLETPALQAPASPAAFEE